MSLKQKKIKFRPRITKDFSMERGGGGGRIVVVVVRKNNKQLIDKGYFNEIFYNNVKQFLKRKFKNNFKK